MSNQNWYRNTTWTPQVREAFFTRLSRTRSDFNKAQYLRIQAYTLQHECDPPLLEPALELLDMMLVDCPEPTELASAYYQKSECLEALGRISDATQAILSSVAAEKESQGVKTNVRIKFAMFVIRHGLREYYDYAINQIKDVEILTLFPINKYEADGAMAIMLADRGKMKEARKFAKSALLAANKTTSGMRNHPTLGLVGNIDPKFHHQIEKIAAQ